MEGRGLVAKRMGRMSGMGSVTWRARSLAPPPTLGRRA